MPGKRVTDHQVIKYKQYRQLLGQTAAAAKVGISERTARLLGYVSTPAGDTAILVRVRSGRPPALRRVRKKKFTREWLPSTQAVSGWAELVDTLED